MVGREVALAEGRPSIVATTSEYDSMHSALWLKLPVRGVRRRREGRLPTSETPVASIIERLEDRTLLSASPVGDLERDSTDHSDHAAVDVAYAHHERMDGKGYPRKLEAHQVPYYAKLIALTDAYDAITSSRVYDSGRSSMEALDIIYKSKGRQRLGSTSILD